MEAIPTIPTPPVVYASVGRRWFASVIDGILLSIFSVAIIIPLSVVARVSNSDSVSSLTDVIGQLLTVIVSFGYYVYMIGSRGQTLGKMAMGIKVIKKDTSQIPGFTAAFLREVVGKILSGIVLGLGYLWAIWDKDKQTWHDKIAQTIVVKV